LTKLEVSAGLGKTFSLVGGAKFGDDDCDTGINFSLGVEAAFDGLVQLGNDSKSCSFPFDRKLTDNVSEPKRLCKSPIKKEFKLSEIAGSGDKNGDKKNRRSLAVHRGKSRAITPLERSALHKRTQYQCEALEVSLELLSTCVDLTTSLCSSDANKGKIWSYVPAFAM
jgi:hypothetical protein